MKSILITDKMYDQLVDLSIEQDEFLEVMACFYLERGIGEAYRLDGGAEFYEAMKNSPHLVGHC